MIYDFLQQVYFEFETKVIYSFFYNNDVNSRDDDGRTLLMNAAINGYKNIVKILLDRGTDINTTDNYGWTALMYAANGNTEITNLLLKRGAFITAKSMIGETALMFAITKGKTKICKLLLDNKVDINAKDNSGNTALIIAARFGYHKIVKTLLNKGADIHVRTENGETALIIAARSGHAQISLKLIQSGIEIPNDKTDIIDTLSQFEWWTDNHSSIINNDIPQEIHNLLEEDSGINLLYLALICGNLNTTQMVIGSDSTYLNEYLSIAAFAGRENIVQYLIECGANPLSKYTKSQTAVHISCARGHAQTLTLLMIKIREREKQVEDSIGINCFSYWETSEKQKDQTQTKTEEGSSSGIQNLGLIR